MLKKLSNRLCVGYVVVYDLPVLLFDLIQSGIDSQILFNTSREAALQTLSCLRLLSPMKFSEQLTRTPQSKWGRAVWNKLNLRKKFPVLRTSATKKCSSRSSSGVRSSWTLTSDFLCRGHCQHGISNPYKVIYDCVISVRNPRPAWLEHPITVSLTLFRAAWFKISPNHPSEWCLIFFFIIPLNAPPQEGYFLAYNTVETTRSFTRLAITLSTSPIVQYNNSSPAENSCLFLLYDEAIVTPKITADTFWWSSFYIGISKN